MLHDLSIGSFLYPNRFKIRPVGVWWVFFRSWLAQNREKTPTIRQPGSRIFIGDEYK